MRISTMEMFLGRGLAAFVTGGGQSFATEITIDDPPGRDYVITVDPAGDKPAANPARRASKRQDRDAAGYRFPYTRATLPVGRS